ncbi:16S rRNA (adenine(1518)-N(6)/adenine(1519)-N(6))-dimethyltransferase RsmA [Paludibacter sp. 221]|uniref:16S rRNA (adenine(1518)-N(6)/adenine(1519)-N(6))- dimethyltransferase RsmA n=1 Tax=Paludibacter sp. 221 TaxID=2302939 RepID=UPI0013D3FFD6|nr:16S rRNA (adenine(1518)-N(6)/adenine(1519)-N(6))-dimethyltransferase RsmA [Paludibacter sp. 221]NDV47089.1 16S rRNA (adenine(1518)-N(6)/adenine(1519)-N(6))-dimethyltransferase RsmA [Paludibacter sp. 221]
MTEVRAKKYLGQHFLKDMEIAQRIAGSLPLSGKTDVLEIGPGMGVLTQFLLQNPQVNLTAVELDTESVGYLHSHYPQLKVIEADFLKLDLNEIFPGNFYIIGNFPYNISSQILFKLLDYKDKIPALSGMFQKEVAERIASPAGKKAYGILSVLLQAFYTIDYLFTVSEHVFDPPPKVRSAVVRLTRNEVQHLDCDEKLFKTVVKTAFNQRRKTLRNSLKPLVEKGNLMYDDVLFDKRPEQLDVHAFVRLTNMVEKAQQNN